VTELLEGDLENILRDHRYPLTLYERMKMARDAAQGIAWLHGSNPAIIHRDLKTSNLLFDKNKRIKVCDFGFSQLFQTGKKLVDEEGAKGTPLYMAPEVMLGDEFNEKADVYSFGIVLWETLTRSEPFSHHSDFDSFVEAVCLNHERPPMPTECLASLRSLITKCWAANPTVRPSFPEIVDALENIIIECAIEDEFGRLMWKTYFLRKEQVLWLEEFVPIFAQFMGITLPNPSNQTTFYAEIDKLVDTLPFKCLSVILADKKDGELIVNLEKFGQVLGWFGPFKDPDGQIRFLQRLESIMSNLWFHGGIEYDDAVHKLKNKPPGTFLIRFSSKDHPNCFTISKVNAKSKIMHQRILHKSTSPEVSTSEGKTYPSLEELVAHGHSALKLSIPCPESPYTHLFTAGHTNIGIYDVNDDDE